MIELPIHYMQKRLFNHKMIPGDVIKKIAPNSTNTITQHYNSKISIALTFDGEIQYNSK